MIIQEGGCYEIQELKKEEIKSALELTSTVFQKLHCIKQIHRFIKAVCNH